MDNMLGEDKNLKDTSKDSVKDTLSQPVNSMSLVSSWQNYSGSYTKTNKLVTALYMVTDTMEKEEPIRLKLRTLGIEILSDISSLQKGTFDNLKDKITSVLSFLNIVSDLGMISEMNGNILKKEFTELKQSLQEFTNKKNLWFEEFIKEEGPRDEGPAFVATKAGPSSSLFSRTPAFKNDKEFSKGQSTRIGVQKGSTLLRALDDIKGKTFHKTNNVISFDVLKKERRESIIKIIKASSSVGVSIKDIIVGLQKIGKEYGEKTLQRELISMVKDNVLKKTGEKRWSKYFLN